ncbi:MAG: methionine synthase [Verrucomicrobia bacterium]|jgi:5-methyltetrahydrofolate--homocysteine methyltransferase|nr:methionine synthase [Verrucomicrobiota bacterium]
MNITKESRLVADGAWGTELFKMGLDAGGCPEEWNLTHPDVIRKVANQYLNAGSDLIITNTFGANAAILERYGLLDDLARINRIGAEISCKAAAEAEGERTVFGSIGPFGRLISMGEVDEDEVEDSVKAQAEALLEGGVDGIVIETLTDLAELTCTVQAVKTLTDKPVVASMSFDSGPAKQCTMMGVTPAELVTEAEAAGADIIGTNCGLGVDNSIRICQALRSATDKPLWIKANAGFPELVGTKVVYSMAAEGYAEFVPELIRAGANIIGGCCGTHADHIKAIRAIVDR